MYVLDDVFQTGVSPVVYSASDTAGNRAECDFNVFLRSKSMFLFQVEQSQVTRESDTIESVTRLLQKMQNTKCRVTLKCVQKYKVMCDNERCKKYTKFNVT